MLNSILGGSGRVCALNELHFFGSRCWLTRGESWDRNRAEKEVALLLSRIERGVWGIGPTGEEIRSAREIVRQRGAGHSFSPAELYRAVLGTIGQRSGFTYVTDQTPSNILFARRLLDVFPEAQVIHIVRDPRGVCFSQKRRWKRKWLGGKNIPLRNALRVWVNYHPFAVATLWRKAVVAGWALRGVGRYYEMRYEDLLTAPAAEVKSLCDFLHIDYEPRMLQVPQSESSHTRVSGTSKGIASENAARWRGNLTRGEMNVLETTLAREMQEMGYEIGPGTGWNWAGLAKMLTFPVTTAGMLILNPRNVLKHIQRHG